jgi:hypothetical protein
MLGAAILIVALLLFPVVFALSGAVAAAALGWSLKDDAEERYEGSELVKLNR